MKTLVSRLSVACHHRSGKYRTWMGWGAGISKGSSVQLRLTPSCQPLTSPAWMVHSKGRVDGVRVG